MTEAEGYTGAEAFTLFEDRAGQLWVGAAGGIYRRVGERFELVDRRSTGVQSAAEDAAGRLWVADPSALVRPLTHRTRLRVDPAIRLPAGGWRMLADSRGQIWVAAFAGLMVIRNPSAAAPVVERFRYEHRLSGSPRALFEDREKNIWVGMRGGLLRLSPSSFTPVQQLEGVNNDGVRTVAVGHDGSVWVATGHALNRFRGESHAAYAIAQTTALHADSRGDLWIATSKEIGKLVDGQIAPLPIPATLRPQRVMGITTDSRHRIWFCSSLRGVSRWDGTYLETFDEDTVATRSCQSIYTDRSGRVWLGFLAGGVAVYDRDTFRLYDERNGLAGGTVLAIIQDRSGAMWFATSSGLSRFSNGRFVTITRTHAPLLNIVPVLVEDDEGAIWIGVDSGAGILRLRPSEMERVAAAPSYHVEFSLFDESDGLQQGTQTWQAGVGGVRAHDGRLWVATGLGMAIIDPGSLPVPARPLPPRIEAVIVDGRRIRPLEGLMLPYRTSTVLLQFGTAALSSASKLRFRYMLDSIDQDWLYVDNAGEASYSGLPPGTHRFRVSAATSGGWTEPTVWTFIVAPPFYRAPAFLLLAGGSVAMVLGAAWWLRLRAIRRQYGMVFAERARVSREIHDTLLQSLAAIGVELETIAAQLAPSEVTAREALRRLRRQVGRAVRDARDSIRDLRHHAMEQRMLADALRELTEMITERQGIPIHVDVIGRVQKVETDIEIQLLRIAQEAIQNAVKHARASDIRVALAYERRRIVLSISDNGCGFALREFDPPPASGEHLGLVTMRERAERVGGTLKVVSRPGAGTTVEAAIPVAWS